MRTQITRGESQPAGNPVRARRSNADAGIDLAAGYYYDHGGETYSENFPA